MVYYILTPEFKIENESENLTLFYGIIKSYLSVLQVRSTYASTLQMHLMSSLLVWIKMETCTQETLMPHTSLVWVENM